MPRYYFVVHAQTFFDDESGTLLEDDAAAKLHARQIIRELKETDSFDDADWQMTVTDDKGLQLVTIPFKQVQPE